MIKLKRLFLLSSFLLVGLSAFSQVTFPTEVGTTWEYVSLNYLNFGSWVGPYPAFTDEISKDTTINNVPFYKVVRYSANHEDRWYFRMDQDRVMYLDSVIGTQNFETELFNYSLTAGDSLMGKLVSIQDLGMSAPKLDYSSGVPSILERIYTSNGSVLSPRGSSPHYLEFLKGVGQVAYEFHCLGENCPDPNFYLHRLTQNGQVLYERDFMTSVAEEITEEASLDAYPNPCTDQLRVRYSLSETDQVSLEVLDMNGKSVHTLLQEAQPAGSYEFFLNPRDSHLQGGIYFVRLQAGSRTEVKKVLYLD